MSEQAENGIALPYPYMAVVVIFFSLVVPQIVVAGELLPPNNPFLRAKMSQFWPFP